jgi:hypothetical protein
LYFNLTILEVAEVLGSVIRDVGGKVDVGRGGKLDMAD